MNIEKAEQIAKELINKHCKDFKFIWSDAVCHFGFCSYKDKEIRLSKPLTELNEESHVVDTILHEIAHALTPKQHHNEIWKEKAISLGCNGKRCCNEEVIQPEANYIYVCSNCSREIERYKRIKRTHPIACGKCCDKYNHGRFAKKYKLKLKESEI